MDFSAKLRELAGDSRGRFEQKLSHEQRCAAFAMIKNGIPQKVVAEVFGIHKITVANMSSLTNAKYKRVKQEYRNYGHDEFVNKYMTSELFERARVLMAKHRGDDVEKKAERREPFVNKGPNKQANRRMGKHTLPNTGMWLEIRWFDSAPGGETDLGPGWYALMEDLPNDWVVIHDTDSKPMVGKTSQEVYDFALENWDM